MKICSSIDDNRVSARSVLIELSIADYLDLARKIYRRNEFQRQRVKSSKSVYSLLKSDILRGCVFPPIVLAYKKPIGTLESDLENAVRTDTDSFVLLDGLQRTHTLLDIANELNQDDPNLKQFHERPIRCEIYEGINRIGILYRMLTLNTGQTPMSVRHQIEMLYLDYMSAPRDDIFLVREIDAKRARSINHHNFRDIIEGVNSYLERSESPLDRGQILENIATLENLAKESEGHDVFSGFLQAWNKFLRQIEILDIKFSQLPDDSAEKDEDSERAESQKLWARTGVQAFRRAQAISGFGAAIGILRDEEDASFESLRLDQIQVGGETDEFMSILNEYIGRINDRAKKIGNAQRLFFRQFFKYLFWNVSDTKNNMLKSLEEAYKSALRIGI